MSELVGVLIFGAMFWLYHRLSGRVPQPHRDRRQDWKDAVDRCGLRIAGDRAYPLTARGGPVEVRIETFGQATRIVVEVPVVPAFEGVRIHPQSVPPAPEVKIGDPGFDDAFSIEGPALELFALLDADTRRRMRAVNAAGRLEISPGRIEAVIPSSEQAYDVLPSLLEIGKRLGTPVDFQRSLVENVERDSEGGVRLQNLLLLLREFPGSPSTLEALRAACSDRSPATRLRAARELGAEGRDALLELAHSSVDDAVSAEALSSLDRELPFERTKALLENAWSTGRLKTALACVEMLGRGGAAAVGLLAEVLAQQNVELAAAAASSLEATGSPDAEPSLIQALQHEEAEVRVAAARALGHIGSVAAVLPLQEAAERSRLDLELRRATRQAIAEIHSRLQGASPGQLSLAGAEMGQLSLAQAEEGQLSLATDPAGQLSLSGEPGQLSLPEQE